MKGIDNIGAPEDAGEDEKERARLALMVASRAMYNVPGLRPVEGEDIADYLRSKESLVQNLGARVEAGLSSDNWSVRRGAVALFQYLSGEDLERAQKLLIPIVEDGIKARGNSQGRLTVLEMIPKLPPLMRGPTLIRAIEIIDADSINRIRPLVNCVPGEGRRELYSIIEKRIRGILGDLEQYPAVRGRVLTLAEKLPESTKIGFIDEALANEHWQIRLRAVELFGTLSQEAREPMIQKVTQVVEQGIRDAEPGYKIFDWAALLPYLPEENQTGLRKILSMKFEGLVVTETPLTSFYWEDMAPYVSGADKAALYQAAFASDDIGLVDDALDEYAHESDGVRRTLMGDVTAVIRKIFMDKTFMESRHRSKLVLLLPRSERESLAKLYDQLKGTTVAELERIAITTSLYRHVQDDRLMEKFEKTLGKEKQVTLLGRGMRGKFITRNYSIGNYLAWAKAYEAFDLWKSLGFDHVPIEPIKRVFADPTMPTDCEIVSAVLGPNVYTWTSATARFISEIDEQKRRIQTGLTTLGVHHGDLVHDSNFCLTFDSTANGKPDISKPPRVYAIDFEHAEVVAVPDAKS